MRPIGRSKIKFREKKLLSVDGRDNPVNLSVSWSTGITLEIGTCKRKATAWFNTPTARSLGNALLRAARECELEDVKTKAYWREIYWRVRLDKERKIRRSAAR